MTPVRPSVLAAIAFVALFLYVAADFYGIRYTTSDDIDYQLTSLGPITADSPLALGEAVAAAQGRLTAFFREPIYAAVTSLRSPLLYTAVNLGVFFFAIATVTALLWWQIGPHLSGPSRSIFGASSHNSGTTARRALTQFFPGCRLLPSDFQLSPCTRTSQRSA